MWLRGDLDGVSALKGPQNSPEIQEEASSASPPGSQALVATLVAPQPFGCHSKRLVGTHPTATRAFPPLLPSSNLSFPASHTRTVQSLSLGTAWPAPNHRPCQSRGICTHPPPTQQIPPDTPRPFMEGPSPRTGARRCHSGGTARMGTAHGRAELTRQTPTAQIHPLQQAGPGGQRQAGREPGGSGEGWMDEGMDEVMDGGGRRRQEEAGRARARAMPERRRIEKDLITHFASSKAAEL